MHEGQIKLEITGGTHTWRLLPSPRQQKMIDRIRATIAPVAGSGAGCLCYHLSDVMLKFPDGSFKRPDIAIFCVEPPDIDEAWEQVPEAVIEIVSLDYEAKDLSINLPWYLAQGVKDVLVIDPHARRVTHCHVEPATRPPVVSSLRRDRLSFRACDATVCHVEPATQARHPCPQRVDVSLRSK